MIQSDTVGDIFQLLMKLHYYFLLTISNNIDTYAYSILKLKVGN